MASTIPFRPPTQHQLAGFRRLLGTPELLPDSMQITDTPRCQKQHTVRICHRLKVIFWTCTLQVRLHPSIIHCIQVTPRIRHANKEDDKAVIVAEHKNPTLSHYQLCLHFDVPE